MLTYRSHPHRSLFVREARPPRSRRVLWSATRAGDIWRSNADCHETEQTLAAGLVLMRLRFEHGDGVAAAFERHQLGQPGLEHRRVAFLMA